MVVAKVFVKAKEFDGFPKPEDIQLIEEELGELEDGEILTEAEFLSVDPYHRAFKYPAGSVMIGGQIAKVIESKNPDYPVGAFMYGHWGWRTHTRINPQLDKPILESYLLPDFGDLSRSLGLGTLGMPGNTANFGFLELCSPKAGETLVVSTAAGAVGSVVGQIGKIKGLRVVGITGSDEKCDWITKELGFDAAINYKTQNIAEELQKVAPNGVDCYFDNVGGEISSAVINQMNNYGRISVCGSITAYNATDENFPKVGILQPAFIFKQLRMEGFLVGERWKGEQWQQGLRQLYEWVKNGQIKVRETVTEGFENMPNAFFGLFKSENIGKAIVKV